MTLVDIIQVAPALHPEPAHQPLAGFISLDGDRHHLIISDAAEGEVERGDGRFLGNPAPPRALAQAPADFGRSGNGLGAGGIDPFQAAEAEQLPAPAVLDQP